MHPDQLRWLKRGLVAAGAAGMLAWALAQSQVNSVIGSYLELGGQVIAPLSSPTINSTNDVSGGDQVRWTTYFNTRIASPFEAEGMLTPPANHTWVRGSALMPSNTTMEWRVSGSWTATEPADAAAVSAVRWLTTTRFKGATTTVNKAVNFSGTGDGYRIIPYKDGLYVVNHHGGGTVLKCRKSADGLNCPNWNYNGYAFNGNNGAALGTSGSYTTPNIPLEAMNQTTGELFVGLNSGSGPSIVCTNLDTRTSCGSWVVGSGAITGLGQVGKYYLALVSNGDLVCFDIEARSRCATVNYPGSYDSGYGGPTSVAYEDRIYFSNNYGKIFCHDPARGRPCLSWGTDGVQTAGSGRRGLYPFMNANGTPAGACSVQGYCATTNGGTTTAPGSYSNFLATYGLFSSIYGQAYYQFHNMGAYIGSKVYGASQYTAACYDFATSSMCGTWTNAKYMAPYTTRIDPTRPNCLMILGDSAQAMIFDPTTGGECKNGIPAKLPDFVFDPINEYFRCDPGRANVRAWGLLRLSPSLPWGGAKGLDRITATLKDANGNLLPANLNPVRNFPANSYQLSLADIPYAQYPVLKVGLELHSPTLLPSEAIFGIDLTYDGDPMQVCVATRAPANPDCQTGASVTLDSRAVDFTTGVFQESLTASKVMSPGGLSTGYAAMPAVTTSRLNLLSAGPRDPKTQLVQGRWALQQFSGDLWGFDFRADGQIEASTHRSAEAYTYPAANRPMLTAWPQGADGVPQPVRSLVWAGLTPGQQAALNLTDKGIADSRGPDRVAYLRGTDGSFRARGGKRLGPVIGSAPVVVPVAPFAGLPEASYPGYANFRQSTQRANPLVLFGGNDGALHAYEALPDKLSEAWSFVPDVMLRKAPQYSDPTIASIRANPYFVDNLPIVGDVDTRVHGWRTVAVITYGRGERAITALDVTKTDLAAGKGVLFEYSATSHPDFKDLGYIVSQPHLGAAMSSPQLVQLGAKPGRAAVLVGNGLRSNDASAGLAYAGTGKAVLYAMYLDATTAPRWHRWAVDELWAGAGSEPGLVKENGLGTPTPIDDNGDGVVDLVYAGDQQGNLWRFDVREPNNVKVTRLFKTEANQPITQAPFVVANPQAGGCGANGRSRCWQVVVATGAALAPLEGSPNVATQSIYSVLDKGLGETVGQIGLERLSFAAPVTLTGIDYRAITGNRVDYARGKLGWRLDFGAYEHGVGAPRVQPTGLLMFSSVRPTTPDRAINVCIGARSWLNEVDPLQGITTLIPFDTNGDGSIDSKDRINPTSDTPLSPQAMAVSGAQFGAPILLMGSSAASQEMSLLLPSLGQDAVQLNSWNGGSSGGSSSSTNPTGQNSVALKHSNKARLGRMTWREVY